MSRKTRKLIWSAPLVAVLAVVGALAIFAAQSPGAAQATHEMLPGAPQNFTIMADGHHAIKLNWDAPSSGDTPDGYRIDRSDDNGTWFAHEPMHTGTSYTDTGLEAGSTWFYRVFAYNTAGAGPVSEDRTETTLDPTNPGRVRALTATATGQNSIRLTWQAPEKNGGAPIKHYEIHFAPLPDGMAVGTFPGADILASDVPDDTVVATDDAVTTFNHGMLEAETRYRYILYAVNEENLKGTEDSALKAATTDDLTAPGRPTVLTAVQSNTDVVQLYWYAPDNNGGTAITGYDTERQLGCTGGWVDVEAWTNAEGTGHDASYAIPTNAEDRPKLVCFRVRAHNSASGTPDADLRYGSYSSRARLVLYATEILRMKAIPPPVAGPAATYTTDRAKVTWTAVVLDDLAADRVSGYRVDVSENGIAWESIRGGSNTNRADDEGMPYFEYNYDGGAARRYRVFAKVAQKLGPAAISAPSVPLTGVITASGHVRNLIATASGPTQIDLTWNVPTSDGGSSIEYYIVQASQREADDVFAGWPTDLVVGTAGNFNFKSEATSYRHTPLKAGETWRYRVFAVNNDAAGDPNPPDLDDVGTEAEVDQATTHQETKPGMPEYLSVETASTSNSEAAGSTGLLLLWDAPQDPAGADISGYQVQRMSNDGSWVTLSESPHTDTTFTDFTDNEALEADETRAYQVRAVSENGVEGAWSDAAYHPAMRTHEPAVPTKPSMVMASSDAAGELMLTWEGGANADSFLLIAVNMADTSDYKTATVSDGAARMGTVAGLTSGVNYLGIVVALQGTGTDRTFSYGASSVQAVQ